VSVLCQEDGGTLINPPTQGYSSLTPNFSSLHDLNKLPLNMLMAWKKHLSPKKPSGIKLTMFCVMQQKWKGPGNKKKLVKN
jgi:hypothetical protein